MGELGWTRRRWRNCNSFEELNYAIGGYWRNWERFAGVPMREIAWATVMFSPMGSSAEKPKSPRDYIKLSIDKEEKTVEKPTEEDIETAKRIAFYGK